MFKINKKFLLVIVMISIMTFTLSGCGKNKTVEKEDVVAKVNGETITEEEFDKDFSLFKNMYEKQYGEDALSQETKDGKTIEDLLKENVLEKLIIEKLIFKEIEDMDIEVTDEELNNEVKTHMDLLGGEEKYKEFLEDNNFTPEFYKENLKKEILYEKHREEFLNKTNLSEDELKKYFETNKDSLIKIRASHILVQTEEEGNKVLEKLKAGESFESLAVTESIDSGSAAQGGDLGYFTKGNMVKEFEDAAFNLKPGEMSELIQSEYGYHIILLEDKKDSYEDLKEDIIPVLENEKYIEKILDLKEKADIEIYMEKDNKDKDDKDN